MSVRKETRNGLVTWRAVPSWGAGSKGKFGTPAEARAWLDDLEGAAALPGGADIAMVAVDAAALVPLGAPPVAIAGADAAAIAEPMPGALPAHLMPAAPPVAGDDAAAIAEPPPAAIAGADAVAIAELIPAALPAAPLVAVPAAPPAAPALASPDALVAAAGRDPVIRTNLLCVMCLGPVLES